jgi:hypothetical protein
MSKPRPVAALLALACLVLPTFAAAQPAIPSTRPSTSPSPSAAVPPMPGASTPEEINRLRGTPTGRSGAATRGLGVPHDTQLPAGTVNAPPGGAAMPPLAPPATPSIPTPGR